MHFEANCFQIKGNEISAGIPLRSKVLGTQLPIVGFGRGQKKTLFGRPEFAKPKENYRIVNCDSSAEVNLRYWFFYLEVPDLDFGNGPFLDGLDLWPGAEWHSKEPFWQRSLNSDDPRTLRQTLERAEIWVLEINGKLLLIDQYRALRLLHVHQGRPHLSEVDVNIVADYLCKRGDAARTRGDAAWVYTNLKVLQKGFPGSDLSEEIAQANKKLTELRR